MTLITYQTDDWGDAGIDHIELTLPSGHNIFITIEENEIELHGSCILKVEQKAVNLALVHIYNEKEQVE